MRNAKRYQNRDLEERRRRWRERVDSDPGFKVEYLLRGRINAAFRFRGIHRSLKTEELLGCPVVVAMAHIEAQFADGMSWDNWGEWEVDHVKPCAAFDLTDPAQQRECFHYSNLQPLWSFDNRSKGDRWEGVA